jgi:hypothetical protein
MVVRVGGSLGGGHGRHRNAGPCGAQGTPEGGSVLEPVIPVFLQGLGQHGVQCRRYFRIQAAGRRGDFADVLVRNGYRAVADERGPGRQHFVEQAGGRVQVAPGVHGLAPRLLRREILCGAHHCLCLGHGG